MVNHYTYADFKNTVTSDYGRRRGTAVFSRDLTESGLVRAPSTRALGHPQFEPLRVGQKETVILAVVFLDLTKFTSRTFWDPDDQVADLAHAIITGFIEVIDRFGGHPLGLRGDGLFAGFGPGYGPTDVSLSLGACAFALNAVQTEVNPWLDSRGLAPVQARAGADYGAVTFVRSGNDERSEVNQIGFAANFAAKAEKIADSWEIVAGGGAEHQLGDATLFVPHDDSPKVYTRGEEKRRYPFFDYHWRVVLPSLPGVLRDLDGVHATDIRSAS